MNKQILLTGTWKSMVKKELNQSIDSNAWLLIDSTIKGKKGKQMHNLQKFKTSNGYTIGHCFVFALLVKEDGSQSIIAVKPYVTKKYCKENKKDFKTQNQLAVEILQEISILSETHLTVVADSAFLADFVVAEIEKHPQWSFVSSLDSNRKITVNGYTSHAVNFKRRHLPDLKNMSIDCNGRKNKLKTMSASACVSKVGQSTVVVSQRGSQTIILIGAGKKLSPKAICYAYLLRWRIEVMFKEIKQYLHLGSYRFHSFTAYMNHVIMVAMAYCLLKSLYPRLPIAQAKKYLTESSKNILLTNLKNDLNKFGGENIVVRNIYQAFSAIMPFKPLFVAA